MPTTIHSNVPLLPRKAASADPPLRERLRENGLSLAIGALFVVSLVGQIVMGKLALNDELVAHRAPPVDLVAYLTTGHFLEALFENWESEFLQMALFVVLTIKLRQKGSSESKKLDGEEEVDEDPRDHRDDPEAPGPVHRGGWLLHIYEHSLTLALTGLFLVSFVGHAVMGVRKINQEAILHGEPRETLLGYLGSGEFWFESFQNWQSEFFSLAAIILLSIWLRQRGSPQSKPVAAPHAETGE